MARVTREYKEIQGEIRACPVCGRDYSMTYEQMANCQIPGCSIWKERYLWKIRCLCGFVFLSAEDSFYDVIQEWNKLERKMM